MGAETTPGHANGADGQSIVGRHAAVFTRPARRVPTDKMVDGPLLGNGDVGVVLAGPPEALRFHIGKNDFWSIRTQAPLAVGQVRILAPALEGASYRAEQDMAKAEVRAVLVRETMALALRAWVDANANRVFIELANAGDRALDLGVAIVQGTGANSAPLSVSGLAPAAFLHEPDSQPGGRKLALCTRLLGGDADGAMATLAPRAAVRVATAILSDLDARDPLAEAQSQMRALTRAQADEAADRHRAWWRDYWRRSFIEIPDKVLEQHWYAAHYVMASCCRAGKVAPGLWGNWITVDEPAWHGDYHLNYNYQAPFYGLYAANHPETTQPFYEAMNRSIPRGRRIAARRGWSGIHLPVSIGPWGMCPEGDDRDWGQRSNAAYAALLYIKYWLYTQDHDWLRDTGYAFLRETAAFWEHYLRLEGGRYVILDDSIHEGSGADMNPLLSLGLVRTLFTYMAPMSEALEVDADRRAAWRDIRARISPFPTQERDGRTVFRYSEKGTAWWDDNTLGIQHIFPAGAIDLDSGPRLLDIARSTIDAMHRWHDGNGFSSWYSACARVGYDPMVILAKLRAECDACSLPNLLLGYGGGGIENCAGFGALSEMVLQSHAAVVDPSTGGGSGAAPGPAGRGPGLGFVIRLFPCWPRELDVRFGTLRAVGGFLVSARMRNGMVSGVRIASEKGLPCTVVNPWPGRRVQLVRDGPARRPVTERREGERFTFETGMGETVELTCQ